MMRIPLLAVSIFFSFVFSGVTSTQAQQTASDITKRYYEQKSAECDKSSRPDFLCNGVIIRATTYSSQRRSWDPSPEEDKEGGGSFSYLRTDANFNRLAGDRLNGYILFPVFGAPGWAMDLDFLCVFPLPGATEQRSSNGCGARTDDRSGATNPCQRQGIQDAGDWLKRYQPKDGHAGNRACGFDVAEHSHVTWGTADAFKQMIAIMNALNKPMASSNISFAEPNELRAKVWGRDQGYKLPIEAFFYIDSGQRSGLNDARRDQTDFFHDFSRFVPIVKVALPQDPSQHASFHFLDSDQAIPPPATPNSTGCNSYIRSGEWTDHPGSPYKSLTLKPTDCARDMHWADVDAAFAEVEKKFGSDVHWKHAMGMRNQLACHVDMAKHKDYWDLEPDRKVESFVDTKRDDCNPAFQ